MTTNLGRCTACHAGYGWDGPDFDFSDDSRVDCLVCHDTTGTYEKAPKRAGRVLQEPVKVHGHPLQPPDLGKVARNVGPTSSETCGSCHIPAVARGGVATKTWWDWSKAGRLDADGNPIKRHDADGNLTYWTRWGEIEWGEDLEPDYRWFDGTMRYTLPDQTIDSSQPVPINRFAGHHDDPDARIWPFKMMRGKQPYDPVKDRLVYMQLFGKTEQAYWQGLEWQPAIASAMEAAGLPFSGEVGFTETVYMITTGRTPTTHLKTMITGREEIDEAARQSSEAVPSQARQGL